MSQRGSLLSSRHSTYYTKDKKCKRSDSTSKHGCRNRYTTPAGWRELGPLNSSSARSRPEE